MRVVSLPRLVVLGAVACLLVGAAVADPVAAADDVAPGVEWTRQFGTTMSDDAFGVAVGATGAVYVAGNTVGALPGHTSSGRGDVWVRKYDTDGNEQWTRQFGTTDWDCAYGVAVDATGAVYLTGFTYGAFPGYTNIGDKDVWVRKYDTDGNEQWTRQFGTTDPDIGRGVAVGATGAVYLTGETGGALPGHTSSGRGDVWVRKYDTDGNEQWTRQFGTTDWDRAYGVAVGATGAVYLTGETGGALPGHTNNGRSDVWVRKYDTHGNEQWTRQFGTTEYDVSYAVAVDATDAMYLIGHTFGSFPGHASNGWADVWVRKYDTDGAEHWTRQFGTTEDDVSHAVAVDASGAVYLTGFTYGAFPGYTNIGDDDVWVRKYDTEGAEQWTRQFGTTAFESGLGVAVDGGAVYLAGGTFGAFAGHVNSGGGDAWVRKYSEDAARCLGAAVTIYGSNGADIIHGTRGNDVIDARGGDDIVYGKGGNDIICGSSGNDRLLGGGGNDTLLGGAGADNVIGGADDDTLYGGRDNDTISGNLGNDSLWGGDGTDILRGWTGTDTLNGGPDDDTLYGGEDNDTISGNLGNDSLWGGDGTDILRGWTGTDTLNGGPGDDTLYGGPDPDTAYGGGGDDYLSGQDGNDTLDGGAGNDRLYGQIGDDYLDGGDGTDTLDGGPDNDECTRGEVYESCEVIL